jgi:hypothetical protein
MRTNSFKYKVGHGEFIAHENFGHVRRDVWVNILMVAVAFLFGLAGKVHAAHPLFLLLMTQALRGSKRRSSCLSVSIAMKTAVVSEPQISWYQRHRFSPMVWPIQPILSLEYHARILRLAISKILPQPMEFQIRYRVKATVL